MKNLITAIALSVVANGALANGFTPWNAQTAKVDTIDSTSIEAAPAGFGPWRERNVEDVLTNEDGYAVDVEANNIFRPWS